MNSIESYSTSPSDYMGRFLKEKIDEIDSDLKVLKNDTPDLRLAGILPTLHIILDKHLKSFILFKYPDTEYVNAKKMKFSQLISFLKRAKEFNKIFMDALNSFNSLRNVRAHELVFKDNNARKQHIRNFVFFIEAYCEIKKVEVYKIDFELNTIRDLKILVRFLLIEIATSFALHKLDITVTNRLNEIKDIRISHFDALLDSWENENKGG